MNNTFDVIIIGGGHAGIEAAHASAKMGARTLLVTLSKDTIGLMPCNPSIGGLGKGHIVYEISALGGLMPRLCSQTYLQSRILNTSKGPAVQGLRLQIDKYEYKKAARSALEELDNLTILEEQVTGICINHEGSKRNVTGITTAQGNTFMADAIVVTTGTFLKGRVHVGLQNHAAGRVREGAVEDLSTSLQELLGVSFGRLKTGTPPRLLRESIDYTKLEYQESHNLDYLFEFYDIQTTEKMPVYIAYTHEKTHKIIQDNLDKSAMYSGNIEGKGPRYCPSIEDKIGRFPGRNHHVFVEPEGASSDEVYPSGLSTSLPLDVQNDYIRSIHGFEHALITDPGYAVEYDFVQPTHLNRTLEVTSLHGLFFAGQINGTTGYEEAAGQGIIAGINAALKVQGRDPFHVSRTESYIGVMIDDLITLGVDEPYRMFTSRAERRLLLRQDNAFSRLMPYGYRFGLVDAATYQDFLEEEQSVQEVTKRVQENKNSHLYHMLNLIHFDSLSQQRAKQILEHDYKTKISSRALMTLHAHVRYEGYFDREYREIEKIKKYQNMCLSEELKYEEMAGLSRELQQKLCHYKPKTIAQAQSIPGMTPAALSILIFKGRG